MRVSLEHGAAIISVRPKQSNNDLARQLLIDYAQHVMPRRVKKEMVPGKHPKGKRTARLLAPSRERFARRLGILQAAEDSDGAAKRRIRKVSVGLTNFKISAQQRQH